MDPAAAAASNRELEEEEPEFICLIPGVTFFPGGAKVEQRCSHSANKSVMVTLPPATGWPDRAFLSLARFWHDED